MNKLATLIVVIALVGKVCAASTESDFIKAHVASFAELNKVSQNFERELLTIKSRDTALKYIDHYSLTIEKVLPIYSKYRQSKKNELIREVSTDIGKMLTDIMKNNYELLGRLVKPDFDNATLQAECEKLLKKNRYISIFLRDVSIGVCMTTAKEKPRNIKEDVQFSKLTLNERDDINRQLIEIFGKEIGGLKKEKAATAFEYSCVAIYEFLNMDWKFEKG